MGDIGFIARDKNVTYELTGTGSDLRKYIAFDLGLKYGTKQVKAVLTLDALSEDWGTFVDVTEEARSTSGSTFTAIPAPSAQYDALYICLEEPVPGLRMGIDTAGVDAGSLAATWEYVGDTDAGGKPITWYDLNEEDGTTSLTAGTSTYSVKWFMPSDWEKSTLRGIEGYWVKFMVGTVGYGTAPVLESIEAVYPKDSVSVVVMDDSTDAFDLHVNSYATAGSVTDNDLIPVGATKGMIVDGVNDRITNMTIKNLASAETVTIIVGDFNIRQDDISSTVTYPGYARLVDGDGSTLADIEPDQAFTEDWGIAKGTQSTTTLQDTDKTWSVDQFAGKTIVAHTESSTTETHPIISNTSNTITITGPWATTPVTSVTHYDIKSTRNALVVRLASGSIDIDEMTLDVNPKTYHYKTTPPDLANNQDTQGLSDIKGRVVTVGAGADGAAVTGNPNLVAGTDGTNAQTLSVDSGGQLQTAHDVNTNPLFSKVTDGTDELDIATDGSAAKTKGVQVMGTDGTNAQTLSTDNGGQLETAHDANTNPIFVKTTDGTNEVDVLVEDAASGGGEKGFAAMVVRKDTAAALCDTDGDYTMLITDANGKLHVYDSGITDITHEEDAVHGSGDKGVMALVVRSDTATALAADGDYIPLIVDANGRLHVLDQNSADIKTAIEIIDNIVLAEDAVHSTGDKGVMALAVRQDSATALAADGDYVPMIVDSTGHLHVLDTNSGNMLTALQLIDDTVAAEGAAATKGIQISLDDGTDTQFAQCNATGDLKVTLDSEVVSTSETVPSTILNGLKTVTTAGTAEALAGSTSCKSVTVRAEIDNTGYIYVGNSGVDSTNGYLLEAGDTVSLDIANLSTVYIDSSVNGEGAYYIGVN